MSEERVGSVHVNISARLDDFRKGLDEAKTKLDKFQKQTHQNFQRMAGGSKQSSINLSKMVLQAGKLAVGLRFVNNALDAVAKNQLVVGDGFDAWEEKTLNMVRIIPFLGDAYADMYEKAKAISPFNSQNILQQKRDQERFRKEVSEARLRDQNTLIKKETEALQKNIKTSTVRMKFETDVSMRGEDALDSKKALVGLDRDEELSKIKELKKSLLKGFSATLFLDTQEADKAMADIGQTISDATEAVNKKHEERLNLLDREKDLRLHNISLSERLMGVEMERGALQKRQQLNNVRSLEFKAKTLASARGEDVRTPDVIHKEKITRVDEDISSRKLTVEADLIRAKAALELKVDTETKQKLKANEKRFQKSGDTLTPIQKQRQEEMRQSILDRADREKAAGSVAIRGGEKQLELLDREGVARKSILDSERKDFERERGQGLDTRLKQQGLSGDDKKLELAFSKLQEKFRSELESMGGLSMTDENSDKLKLFYEREGEKLSKAAEPQAMAGQVQSGLGTFQVGVDPVATKTSESVASLLDEFKTFVRDASSEGIKIANEGLEEG